MKKLQGSGKAIGFAVYLDTLENSGANLQTEGEDGFVNIALPKGRLGEKVYEIFAAAGYECPAVLNPNRKLILENADK